MADVDVNKLLDEMDDATLDALQAKLKEREAQKANAQLVERRITGVGEAVMLALQNIKSIKVLEDGSIEARKDEINAEIKRLANWEKEIGKVEPLSGRGRPKKV
jgi:hypothetical protein